MTNLSENINEEKMPVSEETKEQSADMTEQKQTEESNDGNSEAASSKNKHFTYSLNVKVDTSISDLFLITLIGL